MKKWKSNLYFTTAVLVAAGTVFYMFMYLFETLVVAIDSLTGMDIFVRIITG